MNIIRLQGEADKRNGVYYEYDIDEKPLGEGGMGRVFKGYRVLERTGERVPVAIKAIYDNIPERVVERARREANIQLDNDNLIRMYGFIETVSYYEGGNKSKVHYHVIMELLVGVTLEDIMNGVTSGHDGMQIPFAAELHTQYTNNRYAAIVRIMKSILSGLMALHDKGYIHRDIDPSNVMITADGKIKLIDLGICKQIVSLESVDKALTATGVFMGKVNYAAPELVLGDVKSQNYTTDIYALGVLMYLLCVGHLPFSGTDQDILSANLRKPLPMKDIKNSEFKKIIRKATEKIQAKRYASAAELRVDLEKVGNKNSEIDTQKIAIFGGIAAAAAALVVGVILISKPEQKPVEEIIAETETVTEKVILPGREEVYHNVLAKLSQTENAQLYSQGKEQLRSLAEDSLYQPARIKYFVMLLNSRNPEDVQKGYAELERMATSDPSNSVAAFECGLTLSKGNRYFNVPTMRQALLEKDMDLEKANQWLYISMNADETDYKSAYWAFNNLMEQKLAGTLPSSEDKRITDLYRIFEERVAKHNDSTADIYRNAIKSDGETLKIWGLIR